MAFPLLRNPCTTWGRTSQPPFPYTCRGGCTIRRALRHTHHPDSVSDNTGPSNVPVRISRELRLAITGQGAVA
ncbi:hypothetical protein [Candidatus Synechococcus spongiarum]|nr:hypothetical protein [Candidatus Synechococcus spongiarum]